MAMTPEQQANMLAAGKVVREANMAKRRNLVKLHKKAHPELHVGHFMPKKILATVAQYGLTLPKSCDTLLPKPEKKPKAGKEPQARKSQSFPLDIFPDRPAKGLNGKHKGNGVGTGNGSRSKGNPNAEIILRVLTMLEKPTLNDKAADRLLTVLEKLV